MILVTGATGNVGSSAVRELLAVGQDVRAFVRDPVKARSMLGNDVELAVGDFADASSVATAARGVEAMLISTADGPRKAEFEMRLIDESVRAGVRRIVKVSTLLAEAGSPLPTFDWNGQGEDHLRSSGAGWVILQSCFYMTNLLMAAEPIRTQGILPAPAADGKVAMVDPADT